MLSHLCGKRNDSTSPASRVCRFDSRGMDPDKMTFEEVEREFWRIVDTCTVKVEARDQQCSIYVVPSFFGLANFLQPT